ncbi:putative amino acid permease [Talaromyces proteolyticus]|uniref:Amino acid permease n=1 Tax=Talaromyces proteolyticus TaxID=1131652 RepID=A0AAD4Q431_9EURO|nr:putative amino acid permease [Talaromyces proteolyticus]KAH8705729.1 putative amino acid permease [Talaromyces proteolyticus]
MGVASVHSNDSIRGAKQKKDSCAHGSLTHSNASDKDANATERQDTANTSELVRNRSTLQVAFMSFVLASIPYGLSTTMFYPLINGGPVTIIWGWLAVSLIIICVAASLGEITSVYPTAGGVYYQTFMLSPVRWRKLAAWTCGWSYVAGNILITLAVNFGTTTFLVGCINVFESEIGIGGLASETYQQFLIFVGITLVCNAVSALGNRWLPLLDTFAIFWTFAGLIATIACILALAKNGRHSADYVFGHFEPMSGWTSGWAFCVGLLQAAYATSSTGMIVSMCEEVQNPSVQVPKAMVGAVILNTFAGLLFLIPLVVVLPDLSELVTIASSQPVPVILKSAVGNSGGAFALLIPLIVLAMLCGIGCTTAASRCVWAFARDGAIPGSHLWNRVDKSLNMPLNAMMLSMIVQIALGLIYFGSVTAFNAFSSSGVIFLTVSYAVPIAASLFTGRKQVKNASFNLGVCGVFCNAVALCWTALAVPLFCMPTYLPVTAETVNYACVVFVAVIVIASGWYWIWGHKNYQGPLENGIPVGVEHHTSDISSEEVVI